MTQEDKELLLKDLSARLPYGVKCQCFDKSTIASLTGVKSNIELYFDELDFKEFDGIVNINYDYCKPYLFPMSSMTEEQHTDMFNYYHNAEIEEVRASGDYLKAAYIGDDKKYEWLNRNHFDYRGLIEKGLALDATGLGIY